MFPENVVWSNSHMSRQRMFLIKTNWYLVRHLASHMLLFFHIDYSLWRQPISSHYRVWKIMVPTSTFQARHKQTPATAHELDASHGIYPEEKRNCMKTRMHESPWSNKLHLNHRTMGAIFISVQTDTFWRALAYFCPNTDIYTTTPSHWLPRSTNKNASVYCEMSNGSKSSQIVVRLLAGNPYTSIGMATVILGGGSECTRP